MRIIYDERRENDKCFLVAGLAFLVAGMTWGGPHALSALASLHEVMGVPPQHRVVPEKWAKFWAPGRQAAGTVGGIFLILGLSHRAVATRIAVDERGIKKLRSWGGDCFLIEWANVRSWCVESYEKARYETGTRLVVELASTENPFVMEDARYRTAVVAELSAVVPEGYSRDVSAKDQACMTPPDTLTHSGFSWVESAEGYRLDFPPFLDRQPHDTLTLRMCLGTLAAAIVLGILVANGNPFGDRFTKISLIPFLYAFLFSVACLLERSVLRSAFNRSFACLDIGPEVVTVESRDGREQKWRRAAIQSVRVKREAGGEGPDIYVVMLYFHDGSSLSLFRSGRDDFRFFNGTDSRAAVAWLSTTLRQVLGLPSTVKFEFNGLLGHLEDVIHRKKP